MIPSYSTFVSQVVWVDLYQCLELSTAIWHTLKAIDLGPHLFTNVSYSAIPVYPTLSRSRILNAQAQAPFLTLKSSEI